MLREQDDQESTVGDCIDDGLSPGGHTWRNVTMGNPASTASRFERTDNVLRNGKVFGRVTHEYFVLAIFGYVSLGIECPDLFGALQDCRLLKFKRRSLRRCDLIGPAADQQVERLRQSRQEGPSARGFQLPRAPNERETRPFLCHQWIKGFKQLFDVAAPCLLAQHTCLVLA